MNKSLELEVEGWARIHLSVRFCTKQGLIRRVVLWGLVIRTIAGFTQALPQGSSSHSHWASAWCKVLTVVEPFQRFVDGDNLEPRRFQDGSTR
jgi:hypothetical protein